MSIDVGLCRYWYSIFFANSMSIRYWNIAQHYFFYSPCYIRNGNDFSGLNRSSQAGGSLRLHSNNRYITPSSLIQSLDNAYIPPNSSNKYMDEWTILPKLRSTLTSIILTVTDSELFSNSIERKGSHLMQSKAMWMGLTWIWHNLGLCAMMMHP